MNKVNNNVLPFTDNSSSTSDIDPYINENAIIDNLLSFAQDYDDEGIGISTLSFDSGYLNLFTSTSYNYLYIMTIELNSYDVDAALEILMLSRDNFEVTSILDTYTLEDVSIDITALDVFKNNESYKGYTYKNIYNYYLDNTHDVVGLSAIEYKDNSYISIINVRYGILNDELITMPIEGYNSEVSTKES